MRRVLLNGEMVFTSDEDIRSDDGVVYEENVEAPGTCLCTSNEEYHELRKEYHMSFVWQRLKYNPDFLAVLEDLKQEKDRRCDELNQYQGLDEARRNKLFDAKRLAMDRYVWFQQRLEDAGKAPKPLLP